MLFNMSMFGQPGGGFAPMPPGGPPAGAGGMDSILAALGSGSQRAMQNPMLQAMLMRALMPQSPMAMGGGNLMPNSPSMTGPVGRTQAPTRFLSQLL